MVLAWRQGDGQGCLGITETQMDGFRWMAIIFYYATCELTVYFRQQQNLSAHYD
ncbi:hypothetical protein O9929_23260 [Vibrio lentus]|nr:hypothetical protein [Vibrio lentus]